MAGNEDNGDTLRFSQRISVDLKDADKNHFAKDALQTIQNKAGLMSRSVNYTPVTLHCTKKAGLELSTPIFDKRCLIFFKRKKYL